MMANFKKKLAEIVEQETLGIGNRKFSVNVPQKSSKVEPGYNVQKEWAINFPQHADPIREYQDLDKLKDVKDWISKDYKYAHINFTDENGIGISTAIELKKDVGSIYMIAPDKQTSKDYNNTEAITKAAKKLVELIQKVSKYDKPIPIFAEARDEELEAYKAAGFQVVLGSDKYKPPATQWKKAKEEGKQWVEGMNLVAVNVDSRKKILNGAERYLRCAYDEHKKVDEIVNKVKVYLTQTHK